MEQRPYCFSGQHTGSWKRPFFHTITETYRRRLVSSFLQYQCLYCQVIHLPDHEISQEPAEVHSERHLWCLHSANSKVTSVSAKHKTAACFPRILLDTAFHGIQRVKPEAQTPFLQRSWRKGLVRVTERSRRKGWGAQIKKIIRWFYQPVFD